jgi:hypothetical protein
MDIRQSNIMEAEIVKVVKESFNMCRDKWPA